MDAYKCSLCWEQFDTPAELIEHEQQEENTLFVFGGENVVVAIG